MMVVKKVEKLDDQKVDRKAGSMAVNSVEQKAAVTVGNSVGSKADLLVVS